MNLKQYTDLTSIFFKQPAKEYRKGLLEIKKIPDTISPPPKAFTHDPMTVINVLDRKSDLYSMSYSFLKRISQTDPLISAIINTRISQVLNFVKPASLATNPYCFDFLPLLEKENSDLKDNLFRFIMKMGVFREPDRDDLTGFIKKITRDRLRYDQVNFEIVYNKDNLPVAVYVVDPATIRKYRKDDERYKAGYYTFQVIKGEKKAEFKFPEMAWGVFYERSDIENQGYGISEIEMALHILASKIYAEEYNKYYFLQGGSKGLLFIKKTTLSRTQMSGLQEEWQATAAGYPAAHRIPVLSSPFIDDIKYVNIDRTNKEMEFAKWIDYCVNVLCAVFCISPTEVNFPLRGMAGTGGLLQSEGVYEKLIKHSRDKGLRPLLQFIESLINKYIVFPLTGETYAFVFKGLDELSPKEKVDQAYRMATSFKTVNEVREDFGLKPIPDGNYIASPVYIQAKQLSSMMGFGGSPTAPPEEEETTPSEETEEEE